MFKNILVLLTNQHSVKPLNGFLPVVIIMVETEREIKMQERFHAVFSPLIEKLFRGLTQHCHFETFAYGLFES